MAGGHPSSNPPSSPADQALADFVAAGGASFEADFINFDLVDKHFQTSREGKECDGTVRASAHVAGWEQIGTLGPVDESPPDDPTWADEETVFTATVDEIGGGGSPVMAPAPAEETMELLVEYSDDCSVIYRTGRIP